MRKRKLKKVSWNGNIKQDIFNSKTKLLINEEDIEEQLKEIISELTNLIVNWISEGSNWTLKEINGQYLNVVKYQPLKGSSYIILPSELRSSQKGLINIKNINDDKCFLYCHLYHIHKDDIIKNPQSE